MSMPSSRPISRPIRRTFACLLTVIYLMISLGPLASLALHRDAASPALGGPCSGDCNICGCSPESRATRSCCCSRQRQQARLSDPGKQSLPECCPKEPKETVIASCGCPCGTDTSFLLAANNKGKILPYQYIWQLATPHSETLYHELPHLFTSQYLAPPDPPPKVT
jgi:hypothetical protein